MTGSPVQLPLDVQPAGPNEPIQGTIVKDNPDTRVDWLSIVRPDGKMVKVPGNALQAANGNERRFGFGLPNSFPAGRYLVLVATTERALPTAGTDYGGDLAEVVLRRAAASLKKDANPAVGIAVLEFIK